MHLYRWLQALISLWPLLENASIMEEMLLSAIRELKLDLQMHALTPGHPDKVNGIRSTGAFRAVARCPWSL